MIRIDHHNLLIFVPLSKEGPNTIDVKNANFSNTIGAARGLGPDEGGVEPVIRPRRAQHNSKRGSLKSSRNGANLPQLMCSCQKTTYRRYRKGAFRRADRRQDCRRWLPPGGSSRWQPGTVKSGGYSARQRHNRHWQSIRRLRIENHQIAGVRRCAIRIKQQPASLLQIQTVRIRNEQVISFRES